MYVVYKDMSEAVAKHPEADVLVNFASLRSAYEATVDAMNHQQVSVLLLYLLLFSLSLPLSSSALLSLLKAFLRISLRNSSKLPPKRKSQSSDRPP